MTATMKRRKTTSAVVAAVLAVVAALPPLAGVQVVLGTPTDAPAVTWSSDHAATATLTRRDNESGSWWDLRRSTDAAVGCAGCLLSARSSPLAGPLDEPPFAGRAAGQSSLLNLHCMLTT